MLKSKFKIGDRVRVRKDLTVGEIYSNCLFKPKMDKYKGKIITIKQIYRNSCKDGDYMDYTTEEKGLYWSDEMLEAVGKLNWNKLFNRLK